MSDRWIDLVDPTREELLHALPAAVDPDVVEQLLEKPVDRPRPLLEGHGPYVFGVLVAMSPVPEEDRVESREVDFVATTDKLVTVRKTPAGGEAWRPECL